MARRGSPQQQIQITNRALVRRIRDLSGADSESVKKPAAVLVKTWRKLLSTPGANRKTSLKTRRVRGEPSQPGEAPRMQSGKSRRSIRTTVVGGIRRVGTGLFTLRIQEFGAVSDRGIIEPRPSGRPALEAARKEMIEVTVNELKQPLKKGAL
jgi:hypothetical protein